MWLRILFALSLLFLGGWTHGSGGFPLTNWTQMNLGGGGNPGGLAISAQGVRMVNGDVFSDWIFGTDNTWHNMSTASSMPAANWGYTGSSPSQVYQSFAGVVSDMPCPSSASCAYKYAGGYVFYSGNISKSSPGSIAWCNTGGFTQTADTANNQILYENPGQYGAVDPNDPDHVYVATPSGGVLETFNGTSAWNGGACGGTASTWAAVSTAQIPLSTREGGNIPGYAIAFDSTSGTVTRSGHTVTAKVYIFSQGSTPGVYKSTDGGATFSSPATNTPTTVQHIKVSAATAGAGNVWVVSQSGSLYELISGATAWTNPGSVTGVIDVSINLNNGDQVVALGGGGGTATGLYASINGSNATPSFTSYAGALSGGDTGWLSWSDSGSFPGAVEFDPVTNEILATMGQGVWKTTFPSGSFVWAALSAGMEGAVDWNMAVSAAGTLTSSADDISGCQYTVATAGATRSTCFPLSQSVGLSWTHGLSIAPGTNFMIAKTGGDSGAPDYSGYSTDGFNTNFLPFNTWNATVAASSSTILDDSGQIEVVTSTTGLASYSPPQVLNNNSIVCVFAPPPLTRGVALNNNCFPITVIDSTHFLLVGSTFNSEQQTTGYNYIFYAPAMPLDDWTGFGTIVNVTSDGGLIKVTVVGDNSGGPFLAGAPVCLSGVTMSSGSSTVNTCGVMTNVSGNLSFDLADTTYPTGATYTTGGVATSWGPPGGNAAAATTTNFATLGGDNTFPYCTTNAGSSWTKMRVSGDLNNSAGVTATENSSTSLTLSSSGVTTAQSPFVILSSGRFFPFSGATISGTGVTLRVPVPPGDSITANSPVYTNPGQAGTTGWPFAYYLNSQSLTADQVTANTFYGMNSYVGLIKWTNCSSPSVLAAGTFGSGFLTAAGSNMHLEAVPGQAGHLFFAVGPVGSSGSSHPASTSLYRTCQGTQSTATLQRVPGVFEPQVFGFGKAADGQNYAAIGFVGWYSYDDLNSDTVYGNWISKNDPNNGVTGSCTIRSAYTMTGTISGATLNVSAITNTPIIVGDYVVGSGVAAGTVITALGTGTGGTGTYTVSPGGQSVGSETLTGSPWTNIGTAANGAPGGFPLGWGSNPNDFKGDPFVYGRWFYAGGFGRFYTQVNYLLNRDLDPANDESPVFLNKAA